MGVMLRFGVREAFQEAGPHDAIKSRGLVGKIYSARKHVHNTKKHSINIVLRCDFPFVASNVR